MIADMQRRNDRQDRKDHRQQSRAGEQQGGRQVQLVVLGQAGDDAAASSEMRLLTNTSAQIRTRASASGGSLDLSGVTYGWHDTRGRVT